MNSSLPPCIEQRIPILADALARALEYLTDAANDWPLVLPLHPRTRQAAKRYGLDFGSIAVIDPVGYLDMIALLDGCTRVLTDSGGLQKEAYFFRKPCITLRNATEWVETIEAGWNRLWTGPDYATSQRNHCLRGRRGGREDRGDTRRGALNE